ncbi:hypothetical protein [Roseibium aggregatum]|nr:hypothetical protein [Roseibium aggregatum]
MSEASMGDGSLPVAALSAGDTIDRICLKIVTKTHRPCLIRVCVPAQFPSRLNSSKRMEEPMAQATIVQPTIKTQNASFKPVLLFIVAAGLLMLMSALEPSLVLPMVAFLSMAAVTCLMARRLFQDLTGADAQAD